MPTYLIHFDQKFHHAQHYSGFTDDLMGRLLDHKLGRGARILRAVNNAGIHWRVVRVWQDGRGRERMIKRSHNNSRFCPICKAL